VKLFEKRLVSVLPILAFAVVQLIFPSFTGSKVQAEDARPKGAKAADALEPDNTPDLAVVDRYADDVNINHNFFDQDDEDWIMFWIGSDLWDNSINVNVIGPNCEVTAELYRRNDDNSLTLVYTETSAVQFFITGHFFEGGTYYLRATNNLGIYGDDTDYTVNISGYDNPDTNFSALAGVVESSAKAVIQNATITVRRLGSATATTDENGIYTFAAIPRQDYVVIASAPGFVEHSVLVSLQDGINSQNFTLVPLDPELSVTPASRAISAVAGQTTFDVTNTGGSTLNWSAAITSGTDWVSFVGSDSGSDTGTVTLAYATNNSELPRSATVEFTATGAGNSPTTVSIDQAANSTPALDVQPAQREVGFTAGSTEFIVSNTGFGSLVYAVEIVDGDEWLTLSKADGGGTIMASYALNNTELQRSGIVRVTAEGAIDSPFDVTVIQAANTTPTLDVAPSTRNVGVAAGSTSFFVSNTGFGSLDFDAQVIEGSDWLAISAKGAGGGTIDVSFAANEAGSQRSGAIRVTAAGAVNSPREVTVIQDAAESNPTDLNGDDTIDAVDVQLIINSALGLGGTSNGDVDNSGEIDAVDVQLVINAALGL
jgi:hypothetical protein